MIGVDQSYADAGITVAVDGRVSVVKDCKGKQKEPHILFRYRMSQMLSNCFASCNKKSLEFQSCEIICIIERIRLRSSKPDTKHFISLSYIKEMGALNATIADTAYRFGIPVYSVDTRSWKSQVIGTSKPMSNKHGFPEEKWPTIRWCLDKGYDSFIKESVSARKKKAVIESGGERYTYNDNKADSIGIALYGFLPPSKQKLEVEQ